MSHPGLLDLDLTGLGDQTFECLTHGSIGPRFDGSRRPNLTVLMGLLDLSSLMAGLTGLLDLKFDDFDVHRVLSDLKTSMYEI